MARYKFMSFSVKFDDKLIDENIWHEKIVAAVSTRCAGLI